MMRHYAHRALVQAFSLTMLVMPANGALMRMFTPDAFISVPIQPNKLMTVYIIPRWSMTLVQRRGSFHWTRHSVWYNSRLTVMWVYCIPKLLGTLSRFTSVVITVSGWAGGESIIGPNTKLVFGFWAEPATKRSCWALKPADSTDLSFPWTCDSHATSRCWLNMTAADWSCDSSTDRAYVGRHSGIDR